MKDAIKSVLWFVLFYTGLEYLLTRLFARGAAAIVMYHGVSDSDCMPPEINFHLSRRAFRRHLRFLLRRYCIVPLSRLIEMLDRGERLDRCLVLTFDDGYRNNYGHAAPELERLGLPYAVFVATAYIGTREWMPLNRLYAAWSAGKLPDQELFRLRREVRSSPWSTLQRATAALMPPSDAFDMLSWDQVRAMAARGAEFGAHTHTHANLAVEPRERRLEELSLSKSTIEQHTGRHVAAFAYPYGAWSEAARLDVVHCGYGCALTARQALVTAGCDRFSLPRIGFYRNPSFFAGELLLLFLKHRFRKPAMHSAAAHSPSPVP